MVELPPIRLPSAVLGDEVVITSEETGQRWDIVGMDSGHTYRRLRAVTATNLVEDGRPEERTVLAVEDAVKSTLTAEARARIATLGDGHDHVPININRPTRDRLIAYLMDDAPRGTGYTAFIERSITDAREVERLRAVEKYAAQVVAWLDNGGLLGPWPSASGLVDLRAALGSDQGAPG